MNKKLLIALGILIVLVVGLVSLDCQKMAKQGLIDWIMEEPDYVVKIGENTVLARAVSVQKLYYSAGCYRVRFKGYIYVYVNEPMAWRAGFKWTTVGSGYYSRYVTTCNPGFGKYFTYDTCVKCGYRQAWYMIGQRIDGQVGGQVRGADYTTYDCY